MSDERPDRPACPAPDEADQALRAALADAGRAIESMPHDERFRRVDAALEGLGLHPKDERSRTFMIGVFVCAHEWRLALADAFPAGDGQ